MAKLSEEEAPAAFEVFLIFLKLGLTSFGGPVAHIGYFRDEFVVRRKWLSERTYSDLIALCQFLPGPASSQVGMAVGFGRRGYLGALAAWTGFTLPSAILMILFALGIARYSSMVGGGVLHGLKIAAVAVVAQAVWCMGRQLCTDVIRISIMVAVAVGVLLFPSPYIQVGVIGVAGLVGWLLIKPAEIAAAGSEALTAPRSYREGAIFLTLFFVLLIGLPLLAGVLQNQSLNVVDAFYRAGSLVFGGGHVVLALLQAEVVPAGWVGSDAFLAGYGAAQAVPGPLFTFAAFLGSSMNNAPTGVIGGIIALLAIFLPSALLVFGALPFWDRLRANPVMQAALGGVNAAVVGLLLAALYNPVWVSAFQSEKHFAFGLMAFTALMFWKLPPWIVVIGCAVIGWLTL